FAARWWGDACGGRALPFVTRLATELDARRPRLSTATTRTVCRPPRTSAGLRPSEYGAVVSEPRGAPSTTNVTAAIRAPFPFALAVSVTGPVTLPVGPSEGARG